MMANYYKCSNCKEEFPISFISCPKCTSTPLPGDVIVVKSISPAVRIPNQDPNKGGAKYDGDKVRFSLLEPSFIWGTADVLEHGAKKYDMNNWRKGMLFSRPFNALQRHLYAWFVERQEIDPESGKHHLDEASCNLMFLRGYAARLKEYEEFDDRETIFMNPNKIKSGEITDAS